MVPSTICRRCGGGAIYPTGGISATVRDLALVGQLIANAGTGSGEQVSPRVWLDDMAAGGDPRAWSAGDFGAYLRGTRYRNKWYIDDSDGPLLYGLGIHGQYLFVDVGRRLVVAEVSSQELPIDATPHSPDIAGRIGGTAHPGGLALAPNGREPRLLMAR